MAVQYGKAGALQVRLRGPYGSVAIRASQITLDPEGWKGAVSPFSREVELEGVTATCQVELQPGPELLESLRREGRAYAAENDGGVVTVYAFGGKPRVRESMQVTITEVQR